MRWSGADTRTALEQFCVVVRERAGNTHCPQFKRCMLSLSPRRAQEHYRRQLRTEYIAHCDDEDPEVLRLIHSRALEQARWLLHKYSPPPPPGGDSAAGAR